jgi:nucleotide-sensitive chloride channel 1A
MQLANPASGDDDNDDMMDLDSISLTVVPPASSTATTATTQPIESTEDVSTAVDDADDDDKPTTPTQALFVALSACSNLHPDPASHDEGEDGDDEATARLQTSSLFQAGLIQLGNNVGGLPPPVDGSSGWITAENVHEYFDEEGNWRGGEEGAGGGEREASLGPGAGMVRERAEEEEGSAGVEGGDDLKWRRTG